MQKHLLTSSKEIVTIAPLTYNIQKFNYRKMIEDPLMISVFFFIA